MITKDNSLELSGSFVYTPLKIPSNKVRKIIEKIKEYDKENKI